MTESDPVKDPLKEPINNVHHTLVSKMVDWHISGQADHPRMFQFWKRLLAGDNDPEQIVKGLCFALWHGRYVRKEEAKGLTVNFNISGNADPEALANTIKRSMVEILPGRV